jgi:hypothetical protein
LGVWLPLRIVLSRPFIEHRMMSAIITKAGSDTGVTLFGPADMQISANTTVKVIEGHYTGHFKSVITQPRNVLIIRDIQCVGYVAGSGTRFFGQVTPGKMGNADNVRTKMRERLNFEMEDTDDYQDMLAFFAPYEETERLNGDTAFSLTQMEVPWDIGRPDIGDHSSFPGKGKCYNAYEKLFDLNRTLIMGADPQSISDRDFVRNGTYSNSFLFPGPYRTYTPFSKTYYELTPGQGHFGPDAQPGVRRVSISTHQICLFPLPLLTLVCIPIDRTRAGGAASRSRSKMRAVSSVARSCLQWGG